MTEPICVPFRFRLSFVSAYKCLHRSMLSAYKHGASVCFNSTVRMLTCDICTEFLFTKVLNVIGLAEKMFWRSCF